jgi:hypothetical protein
MGFLHATLRTMHYRRVRTGGLIMHKMRDKKINNNDLRVGVSST